MGQLLINNVSILNNPADRFSIEILDGKINSVNSESINSSRNSRTINFEDALAFPGLINAHDHLEFNIFPRLRSKIYRDYLEWGNDIHSLYTSEINAVLNIPINLRLKFGLIKNLLNGITTVMHHGKNSVKKSDQIINVINNYNYLHSVRLEKNWRIKLILNVKRLPFVIHIGEGVGELVENESKELFRWNLFKRKIIAVHGISLNTKFVDKLDALIWCPDSNLFLYNKTANVFELKNRLPILFGSDSNMTADSNFWNHIRIARGLNLLNDKELIDSLTSLASKVLNATGLGKIETGYQADIVVVKKKCEDNYDTFFNTNPQDILLITRFGKIILFDESLKNECEYLNYYKFKVNDSIKFADEEIIVTLKQLKKYKIQLPLGLSTIN